jgi:hypothetical protein
MLSPAALPPDKRWYWPELRIKPTSDGSDVAVIGESPPASGTFLLDLTPRSAGVQKYGLHLCTVLRDRGQSGPAEVRLDPGTTVHLPEISNRTASGSEFTQSQNASLACPARTCVVPADALVGLF